MAIKNGDLFFRKSERSTQHDDGGGKITGHKVVGHRSNDTLPPITEGNRVMGDLSFGKVWGSVNSYGDKVLDENGKPLLGVDGQEIIMPETLQDASVFISKNPEDPNVSALIFKTGSMTDEVKDARLLLSSHITATVRLSGELVGLQLKDSKLVQLAMQLSGRPPAAGDTVYIVQDEGKASEIKESLKIERVTAEERDINVIRGNEVIPTRMKFVTLKLYYALKNTYDGGEVTGIDTVNKRAFLRGSQTTDSGRYKGCKKLKAAAKVGDYAVNIADIYGQLISPMEKQDNIMDVQAGSDVSALVDSGGEVSFKTPMQFAPNVRLWVQSSAIKPGSLKIVYSGATLEDNGGQLMNGDTPVGTVDYHTGIITFGLNSPVINGEKTVTCKAAASPIRVADTEAIKVTETTRSDVYNITLFPLPQPGGVRVDFKIQDHWYSLRDNGAGVLVSDIENVGIGTINYATGSVGVTFAELVDVNSSVLFTFAVPTNYINRGKDYINGTIDTSAITPKFSTFLTRQGIQRGTLILSWPSGKTARDDGKGKITGDATGTIDYTSGELNLFFAKLPGNKLKLIAEYEVSKVLDVKNETLMGYAVTGSTQRIQLTPNLRPLNVKIAFNVVASIWYNQDKKMVVGEKSFYEATIHAYDDGLGNLITTAGGAAGTVDYDTGLINLITHHGVEYWVPTVWTSGGTGSGGYTIESFRRESSFSYPASDGSQYIDIDYVIVGDNDVYSEELSLDSYYLSLTPTYQEIIVPGSVLFTFGGKTYKDILGTLYTDINPATGAGTYAGYINYESGEVTILGWEDGATSKIEIKSLLTSFNMQPVSKIDFRISGAPIRPASLQLLAVRSDGVRLEGIADEGGDIKTSAMIGYVDSNTGIVNIKFGQEVSAEGHENDPWFKPENVVNGKIWQPYFVYADTIKYNAVITKFSPVDPEILKINPSDLPINGKTPIFRAGDLVILHEEKPMLLPINPPVNYEFNLPGERLSQAWLEDQDGAILPDDYFEYVKITGEAKLLKTIAAEYKQPIKAVGTIEQLNSITDAQISGKITLSSAVTHDFSSDAHISGLLFLGDIQARYTHLFEQSKWSGKWEDYNTEGNVNWKYNDRDYPLVLTNADSITERWALVFTSRTEFNIIAENEGVIVGTGSINADCAPINKVAGNGKPYFILKKGGWGTGQETGNVLRFNTIGAQAPIWLLRTVIPGRETNKSDFFTYRFRGEVPMTKEELAQLKLLRNKE